MKQRFIVSLIAVAWTLGVASIGYADPSDECYRLPLIGNFAVLRDDGTFGPIDERGKYQLIDVYVSSYGGFGFNVVVPKVEEIAVSHRVIAGRSSEGLFLLNTARSDPVPRFFASPEDWRAGLVAEGVSEPVVLGNPDSLAANVPARILRPWSYRSMRGLLGLSDDLWSVVVQLLGLIIAFSIGLRMEQNHSPMVMALALGILVNIVAQIFIAGGGPGAFVGFIAFPVGFFLAASFGKGIRRLEGRRKKGPSLIGLQADQ